jgi:hypothetical protein
MNNKTKAKSHQPVATHPEVTATLADIYTYLLRRRAARQQREQQR